MPQKANRLPIRKWTSRVLLLLVLWIGIHILYISIDGLNNYKGSAGVAIILGNHVFADGRLSPWLQGRVDAALDLYKTGRVQMIFASGGISLNDSGNYPEGNGMKEYLLRNGVPDSAIIADNKGTNTYLTAKNFINWNKTHHYNTAIVVSQFYHITRSKFILRKLGFKNVHGVASCKYAWADVFATLREVAAFYKYALVYRGN